MQADFPQRRDELLDHCAVMLLASLGQLLAELLAGLLNEALDCRQEQLLISDVEDDRDELRFAAGGEIVAAAPTYVELQELLRQAGLLGTPDIVRNFTGPERLTAARVLPLRA